MLILVRHGIRGIENINSPFFAPKANLSFFGQIYSYKFGKYVRKHYGIPTLIYPDNNTERTISTGIAIAKSCKISQISVGVKVPDPFFSEKIERKYLEGMKRRLFTLNEKIERLGEKVGVAGEMSDIEIENGKVYITGLLKDLAELSNVPSFCRLSKIENSLCKDVEKAFDLKEKIVYSDICKRSKLFPKIQSLLNREKLSVLIGHDETNIGLLSLYFGKEFNVPGYACGYIPPNSGFIFFKEGNSIRIQIIYLALSGKFATIPYLSVSHVSSKNVSELKTLNI